MDESKSWLVASITSFVGLNLGILIITLFLPLSFIAMGETNVVLIAEHCGSFKMVAYWTIGMGGITILFYLLVGIGSITRTKKYNIFVICLLFLHLLLSLGLMVWGLIPYEGQKTYLNDMWKDMNETTVDIIQNHYSCCGFDNSSEYNLTNPMRDSCYAVKEENIVWPDGCYSRVLSSSLPKPEVKNSAGVTVEVNSKSTNPLVAAFVIMFVLLYAVTITAIISFVIAFKRTDFDNMPKKKNSQEIFAKTISGNMSLENISTSSMPSNETKITQNGSKAEFANRSESRKTSISSVSTEEGKKNACTTLCFNFANSIAFKMEEGFFSFGIIVGKHPKYTIILSLIVAVTLSLGMLQRREQDRGSESFLPRDLEINNDFQKYLIYFPNRERLHQLLIESENSVLTREDFQKAVQLDKQVQAFSVGNATTYGTLCQNFNETCNRQNLFELWNFDESVITQLTDEQVLNKVNEENLVSPIFKDPIEIETLIGGLEKDSADKILEAKAHLLQYYTTKRDNDWEDKFVEIAQNFEGLKIYMKAENSRSNATGESYTRELPLLFVGFALVFVYISIMTGKFSLIKHRVWIALLGVGTAGLSLSTGIGFAASLQFEWTVLHLIGPFLIIGIGVDDMFILIQAWHTVDEDPALKQLPVYHRAGFVLKSAGVSITITSVTDLVAFAVGASSQLPAFESFSIYTAICIILLFGFQCTFFLACTVVDQNRRDAMKDACICCYQHGPNYKEGKCAQKELFQRFWEDVFGWILSFKAAKAVAILLTLALSGVMAWGFYNLQVGYDPDWYLPTDSFLIPFGQKVDEYFSGGLKSSAFVIDTDFYAEQDKLTTLYIELKNNTNINSAHLKSWYEAYKVWPGKITVNSAQAFYMNVLAFLQSADGINYKYDVIYGRDGTIKASKFPFEHVRTTKGTEEVAIIDNLREVIKEVGFTGSSFPFSTAYFNFEIVKIIRDEVYRNLGITMLCVFLVVLPMMASIQMSFWVALCVVLTIIDVAGTMHFIGLYIETSTIITLLLTVGLAVDYAAHIAHKFLTLRGTRNLRMRVAVAQVGPAVFNGGFSTFLALVLLAGSDTYSYKVFFTVFTCVVGFGLWNGLVFLPAVLGIIGPDPHKSAIKAHLHSRSPSTNKINHTIENPYAPQDIERS